MSFFARGYFVFAYISIKVHSIHMFVECLAIETRSSIDKAPRLSIRKDIWILLSDSICQTQPNHIQIVRRQCCPATHSLGDSRAERKCPWSWIRSLLPTAVRDLNRGTGYNFVPKSLDAWFQRFNKTPQRSSRTTEKVNVKMRPNVTNPYLAVSICMGRWLTTQWVQHCRKVFRK